MRKPLERSFIFIYINRFLFFFENNNKAPTFCIYSFNLTHQGFNPKNSNELLGKLTNIGDNLRRGRHKLTK